MKNRIETLSDSEVNQILSEKTLGSSIAQICADLMNRTKNRRLLYVLNTIYRDVKIEQKERVLAKMIHSMGGHYDLEKIPSSIISESNNMKLDLSFNSTKAIYFSSLLKRERSVS